jgi:prolyl 4-hydroxylase
MSMSTSKAMPDAGASAASSAKPPNKPTRASSFPWLSLLVGILAVAVAALALLQPAAMHAARTRTLQFVDRLLPLGETSASVDCSRAQQYLTDVLPVKGFHVMCLEKQPGDRYARSSAFGDVHGAHMMVA